MSGAIPLDLTAIHHAYYAKVIACATKFLGRADADDVAQEVFIKIDRSLDTLSEPAKLGAWIYTITLNTIRDFARRQRTRADDLAVSTRAANEVEEPLEIPDAGARSADEAIERREMIACYLEYVGQLPPAAYEVYVLSEFEGLSDVSRGSPRRIPSHSLNVSILAQAPSREGPAAAVLPGRRS